MKERENPHRIESHLPIKLKRGEDSDNSQETQHPRRCRRRRRPPRRLESSRQMHSTSAAFLQISLPQFPSRKKGPFEFSPTAQTTRLTSGGSCVSRDDAAVDMHFAHFLGRTSLMFC